MRELSRRSFTGAALGLACVPVLGSSLFACSTDSSSTSATGSGSTANADGLLPVTVGYWGGTCEAPIFIANELGYFEEEGLAAEMLVITSDVAPLMAGDELDCYELTPDMFKPIEQGLEVKIIDSLHIGCIGGAASVESGIKTVADLEGKTVAANTMGGIAQIQISSQMVLLGKDPTKVNWVVYPNAEMELALDRGEIDAFGAYDPFPSLAWQNGKTRFYSNTYDEGLKEYLCCFIGLSQKTLDSPDGPEIAARLSAVFKRACAYLEENPAEAAELIQEAGYIAGDAALNAQCIEDYTWVAGDRQLLDDSIREIWMQVYRAGALTEAPEGEAALEEYIAKLHERMVAYYGE